MKEFDVSNFGTGCIESKYDARDYVLSGVALSVDLPEKFEVLHSNIKNQDNVGSCVAHSVCEVLEAASKNTEKYSTNWVYGYRPQGYYVGPGMMTRQACQTVIEKGYLLYEDFPGNTEMNSVMNSCNKRLNELIPLPEQRRAIAYNRLKSSTQIKEAIYTSGLPVLIVVYLPSKVLLDDNNIIQYEDKQLTSCHCMVCYGWNEYGLLIQNSWGKSWGNNGTFILPEEYPIQESWAISCNIEENISERPRMWCLRKFIQSIIKLFRK